ncbi:MAG: uroporphyrinogen decarboxylase/cobalamine-independent methonine synthase family protein [Armatimonadota bacterium]
MTMPIEHIPDWEQRLARQDAFWQCEIIDRPVVNIWLSKPNPEYPWPAEKSWPTMKDRWLDTDYLVESRLAGVMNSDYLGDALPSTYPNLGPEVFSAFFGCEMDFSESTSWTIPNLHDWAEVGKVRFSRDNLYWKKLVEMTDALIEAGKGKFYVGNTDYHPGADAIAAFRDPLEFNMDMIEYPGEIKGLLRYVTDVYFECIDYFFDKFAAAQGVYSTWPGIVTTKRYYVPSNDFSIMISKEMFDDLFLPGITEECDHMEANIYHLDGPGALRHLDSLLGITSLNAIQWVYGAGNGRASDWLPVYKKCQAAGKGLQINLELDEIDLFMRELKPNGLWLAIHGVQDRAQGEAILKKMMTWK